MLEGAANGPLDAPSDRALVVFIRPSGAEAVAGGHIIDAEGRFLGDAVAESHFAVPVEPGEHMFVVYWQTVDCVRAELAAGRTYFVEVFVTSTLYVVPFHMRVLRPGTAGWERRQAWLQSTRRLEPDTDAGQRALDRRPRKVAHRIDKCDDAFSRWGPKEVDARTIRPDDGI